MQQWSASAWLLLEDGLLLSGQGFGAPLMKSGEICFNVGMSGYQETLTDPSYNGQLIVFSFPHIGNIGCNHFDNEAQQAFAQGLIVRNFPTVSSNYRAENNLHEWLCQKQLPALAGVDTRALIQHLRRAGSLNAALLSSTTLVDAQEARKQLQEKLNSTAKMQGLELASKSGTTKNYTFVNTLAPFSPKNPQLKKAQRLLVLDLGAKESIMGCLAQRNWQVEVMPAKSSFADIMEREPSLVLLSNGPGDPAATSLLLLPLLKQLLEANVALFGVCLGHQLLALALGAKTRKMNVGHRGANHPVQQLSDSKIYITSQNHGFVVDEMSLPKDIDITHISLFDGSIEGIRSRVYTAASVQFHPEASPGPHEAAHFFDVLNTLLTDKEKVYASPN